MIESRVVQYPDLKTAAFTALNPLQKVPALIRADGTTVFESNVILAYLEDKYKEAGPSLEPPTAEAGRRCSCSAAFTTSTSHRPTARRPDFRIRRAPCTSAQAGTGAARGMDLQTRAAKLGEIWRQLSWLEAEARKGGARRAAPARRRSHSRRSHVVPHLRLHGIRAARLRLASPL